MLNLDTHIVVHAMTGTLTRKEKKTLAADRWSISAIVLWELSKLSQLGRVELDLDDRDVIRFLGQIHTWPIDLEVALTSTRLDVRCDPADEIIVATSIVHAIPLVTRDRTIRRSKRVQFA